MVKHTKDAVAFIDRNFRAEPGYLTASSARDVRPQREENIQLSRLANLLFNYTGKPEHRAVAERALRFLTAPEIAKRFETGGVLLADLELRTEPLHVTVVGPREEAGTQALLRAAAAIPVAYKRVELLDAREGPLPRSDVTYPRLARPAAFLCAEGRCSAPSFTSEELESRLKRHASSTVRSGRALHFVLALLRVRLEPRIRPLRGRCGIRRAFGAPVVEYVPCGGNDLSPRVPRALLAGLGPRAPGHPARPGGRAHWRARRSLHPGRRRRAIPPPTASCSGPGSAPTRCMAAGCRTP